jgi:hypothetical protein
LRVEQLRDTVKEAGSQQSELQRSIQEGGVGVMAFQRPQRGEGGGGAGHASGQ